MDVFLDDKLLGNLSASEGTLEEMLQRVQSDHCSPDQVVVRIRGDGADVAGDAMTATLAKPAASFERLEVFTDTREALVIDAMKQASACLADTETACQDVARLLSEGKTAEGTNMLGDCLRVWQQVHEAVSKSISMLQERAGTEILQEENFVELIGKPKEVLLQVKEALKAKDYVLLGDILQYEFHDVTNQWQEIVVRLQEEAESLHTAERS